MYSSRPYTFDRVVRIVITCVIVVAVVMLIARLEGVLLPFGVACLVAYMLEPFVQFNRKLLRLKGRTVAIFVTLFEALFLVAVMSYFIVPIIIDEMHHMALLINTYASTTHSIPFVPAGIHDFLKHNFDLDKLSELMGRENVMKVLEGAVSQSWQVLTSGITVVISALSWLIVVLYVIFIMLDYDKLGRMARSMVPAAWRRTVFGIGRDIQNSMNHYFRGQALVAFCVGVLFSIGFLIIDLPMAILLGMFIGLLNMVPYLQLISIVPTTLLCVVYSVDQGVDFWIIFWECMAVYAIVQCIQDLYLVPKIMGKAMGLNPAIILLSLSVWGSLLGFLGLIIALPLTTLLLAYYDKYLHLTARRRKDKSRFNNIA